MDLATITGYILYAILIFINFGWIYGVRVTKNVMYPTVLTSFYFFTLFFIFTFGDSNRLWLTLWIPVVFLGNFINLAVFTSRIPFLTNFAKLLCDLYAGILRIGKH